MSKVTTKRGDNGLTDILYNQKEYKTSELINVIGGIDELSSFIHLTNINVSSLSPLKLLLNVIDKRLVYFSAEVAAGEYVDKFRNDYSIRYICDDDITFLESIIHSLESSVEFDDWITSKPQKILGAQLDCLRTITRRVERDCWKVITTEKQRRLNVYINRLSDLFFVLARIDDYTYPTIRDIITSYSEKLSS